MDRSVAPLASSAVADPLLKTVLIADGHRIVAEGIAKLIGDPYSVIDIISDGGKLLSRVRVLKPDFVLIDPLTLQLHWQPIIRLCSVIAPVTKVLVITCRRERPYVLSALQAGASGYVLKNERSAALKQAMVEAASGSRYLSPGLCFKLRPRARKTRASTAHSGSFLQSQLTRRQLQILHLVSQGLPSKQIAFELSISHKTVDVSKAVMLRRLGFKSVAQLICWDIQNGITKDVSL